MLNSECSELRLILGDQLIINSAIINQADIEKDVFLMCEVASEMTYVKHHAKKVLFVLSAMRHFAEELKSKGFHVDYVSHDDSANTHSLTGELTRAIKRYQPKSVSIVFPAEERVWCDLKKCLNHHELPLHVFPDEKFMTQPKAFKQWAEGKKQLVMEYFYRQLRKRHNILMDDSLPTGGIWNFDKENRKKPPKSYRPKKPYFFKMDTITKSLTSSLVSKMNEHPGTFENFHYAVTREDALIALAYFIKENLPTFGDYQDAMLIDEPWMSHSHLSFYLNIGLLLPQECITEVEKAYRLGHVKINNAEGFIRQILGWREYVRGLYWLYMPSYKEKNFLGANRSLPKWFWTAETKMTCLKQSISQTLDNAYAHHIQRLMVIGNFCLLTGINPKEVSDWYLAVYADAFEWVELPNVLGMILYADGGMMASKPYAAGGQYIKKMSNYCQSCHFNVSKKVGEDACPFNYLYWSFIDSQLGKLNSNPRMRLIINNWSKQEDAHKDAIRKSARVFLNKMETMN